MITGERRYASAQKFDHDREKQMYDTFDWFWNFENLRSFLMKHLPILSSGCYSLRLGCRNSITPSLSQKLCSSKTIADYCLSLNMTLKTLTADLRGLGHRDRTSVDFSEVVVDAIVIKYAALDT